ncbi:RluA family pseudouridine synthase [Treponema sp.]|uniref:RluA family pseudouridine synthase n=1 Tax=Treponema sp. TaxID=166 RepID=UPI00298DBB59|nr:RluA family pseudouridine synthase [Treponema sp.]MCQ2240637.1 RluA family pseudouridine synthase [Treponema sp.]
MAFFSNKVPTEYSKSERLDKYISGLSNGMNRSKLKSGVVSILVNGKNQKVSYKVKAGDQIDIQWEENIPDNIEPQDIPLDIIYEDDNVCVVDKKQGMVTHPACGNWDGTLVNALLYHWGRQAIKEIKESDASTDKILANRRPGIVHRLDKETSGIIITAKNRPTEEYLAGLFRNHRKIKKEYICICMGRPQHQHGKIKTQIVRDMRDRKKFRAVTDTEDGKYAETHYSCIACYGEYSLMRVRIVTGRTHQIRVHMKFLNCPILGDGLYAKADKKFPDATLMLNAHKLTIKLPGSNEYSEFKNKTPERFLKIMKVLHRDFSKVILPKDR